MPGGAAEIDEWFDLFAIWKEQDDRRPKGGVNPAAVDAWKADSFENRGVKS